MQQALPLRSFATYLLPDPENGYEREEGSVVTDLLRREIFPRASLQVGWGVTTLRFLCPPPEDPAFTPELDDACVSTVWPSPRRGGWGWGGGKEGVFLSARI